MEYYYPMELSFKDENMYYRAILHVNFNYNMSKCYLCDFPPMSYSFYTLDEVTGLGVHAPCAVYAAYCIFGQPRGISMPSLPSLPPSSYSNISQQLPQLMYDDDYHSAQPPPPPPTTTFNYSYSSSYRFHETPQYMNYYHSAPPRNYNYANGYNYHYHQSTKYIANAYHYVAPPPSTIILNSNSNSNGYGGMRRKVRNFLWALFSGKFPGY